MVALIFIIWIKWGYGGIDMKILSHYVKEVIVWIPVAAPSVVCIQIPHVRIVAIVIVCCIFFCAEMSSHVANMLDSWCTL